MGQNATEPLSDYGKLYISASRYSVVSPATTEEVRDAVLRARSERRSIRVRASAHTFSGATLPREDEILLLTRALDHYRFESSSTISVGAGAIVWDVRDFVSTLGLQMPVYNGGWAGPSLGGYLSAGGMGLRVPPADRDRWLATPECERPPLLSISETHGGFWEHVESATLVDGTGAVHEIAAGDDEFPWLFGSFGQLGVCVELKLNLLVDDTSVVSRRGGAGRVPRTQADDPAVNDRLPSPRGDRLLFWFSYLVSPDQEETAWRELHAWALRHAPFLRPQGGWVGPSIDGDAIGYRYFVRFRRFNPPLLYPRAENFVLMGLMTTFEGVGTLAADDRILALEREFIEIATRHGFRLYPQAENIGRTLDYSSYYGAETFAEFARLKQRFDPDGLMNPGVVFPSATPAPQRTSLDRLYAATFARLLGES